MAISTTTIRVDIETHARIVELSSGEGTSLMETVRDAVEALRRQRFAGQVATQLETLRADPAAWVDYLTDAESSAVPDGVK